VPSRPIRSRFASKVSGANDGVSCFETGGEAAGPESIAAYGSYGATTVTALACGPRRSTRNSTPVSVVASPGAGSRVAPREASYVSIAMRYAVADQSGDDGPPPVRSSR
jgi:hypothetical protein